MTLQCNLILPLVSQDDRNDISLLLMSVITALRLSCKDAHPTKLLKQASLTLLRTISICCGINADQVQPSSTKIFCSLLRDIIQVSKLYLHSMFNSQYKLSVLPIKYSKNTSYTFYHCVILVGIYLEWKGSKDWIKL
jgi:hypothetical protein